MGAITDWGLIVETAAAAAGVSSHPSVLKLCTVWSGLSIGLPAQSAVYAVLHDRPVPSLVLPPCAVPFLLSAAAVIVRALVAAPARALRAAPAYGQRRPTSQKLARCRLST